MVKKYLDLNNLAYYDKLIKEYIDIKMELTVNKQTNCPNCGAIITGLKCEYCGTNFGEFKR